VLAKAYSLIEELEDVLQSIINSGDPELLKKKQQIEVINTTMEQLLSCDLPVPDDLTSRKKSLEVEIAWMDDPDLALPLIRDELVELIGDIDDYFIQSGKQPIKRNIGGNKKTVIKSKMEKNSFGPGEITGRDILETVLIEVLRSMGGRGEVSEVKDGMIKIIGENFTDRDNETLSNGTIRWWNSTQWIRQKMVDAGVFRDDSPHGVWELK